MAVKETYEVAGQTWQSAYSDIGNTYQAVLTQGTGWHVRGSASEPLCDPMTESVSQDMGFNGDMSADRGLGWGSRTSIKFDLQGPGQQPDSGFGPGKSDPGMDRG